MRAPRGWGARIARVAAVALVAALGPVACGDDGPEGPGTWTGLVRSSTAPAGAVIVEVRGEGIQEVEGLGPASAFAHRAAGSAGGPSTWRVVLVTPQPGDMGFRVAVDDVATGAPRAVVLAAVDGEDQPLSSIASFSVEMSR